MCNESTSLAALAIVTISVKSAASSATMKNE